MQIEPDQLFESVITWLRERYRGYRFFAERDLVWTIQVRLVEVIEERELPYRVFNDYPMGLGARTDIAIVDDRGDVGVAIEVKYEPDHARRDIPVTKFPVVFWGNEGVGRDVQRIQRYVQTGAAKVAYALFIDEGGYFRGRPAYSGSNWVDWSAETDVVTPVAVHWSRAPTPVQPAQITGAVRTNQP